MTDEEFQAKMRALVQRVVSDMENLLALHPTPALRTFAHEARDAGIKYLIATSEDDGA